MLGLALAGCGARKPQPPPVPAPQFLQDTLRTYAGFNTYAAQCAWSAEAGGKQFHLQRTLSIQPPAKYQIVTVHDSTYYEKSVCDNAEVLEYDNSGSDLADVENAPDSIVHAASKQMKSPFSAGDPFYSFFCGVSGAGDLVTPTSQTIYGRLRTLDGVDCQDVGFDTPKWGRVTATIGVADHLVRRIVFDGARFAKPGAVPGVAFNSVLPNPVPAVIPITENYTQIKTQTQMADAVFDTNYDNESTSMPAMTAPGNNAAGPQGDGEGGVAVGTMVKNFSVVDTASGRRVDLASQRGHFVMIDFWATWCGPCRMSLPHTQEAYDRLGSQGLHVMTISNEDQATITAFKDKYGYTFPAYRDDTGAAETTMNVGAIPAVAIIDPTGRLQSFTVGYDGTGDTLNANLHKAGFDMSATSSHPLPQTTTSL
jgi:thiol-disulfide isomerase/thioredoxin